MILTILLLIVFLLASSGFLFFFFCFFVPALKSKYFGVSSVLSTERNISCEEEKTDSTIANPKKRAVIESAQKDEHERRLYYTGLKNCAVFHENYESEYNDFHGCAGFGDCMNVCHQNAIQLENGIAVVTDLCDGCGLCLDACPVSLISLVDKNNENISLPARKHFKFWQKCYRIIRQRS